MVLDNGCGHNTTVCTSLPRLSVFILSGLSFIVCCFLFPFMPPLPRDVPHFHLCGLLCALHAFTRTRTLAQSRPLCVGLTAVLSHFKPVCHIPVGLGWGDTHARPARGFLLPSLIPSCFDLGITLLQAFVRNINDSNDWNNSLMTFSTFKDADL